MTELTSVPEQEVTGFEAGLSGEEQIQIALKELVDKGGMATMAELYEPLERVLNENSQTLSYCVIRAMPISDSGVCRSAIPAHADHYFRAIPIN